MALGVGCIGPRYEPVYDRKGVEIRLREDGPAGFEHPVEISPGQLLAELERLQVRVRDGGSTTIVDVVHPDVRTPTAEGLAEAFRRAGPDQSLSVRIVRRERRLALLDRKFLTTFLAYRHDERLVFDLSRVEWEIPLSQKMDRLPAPRPHEEVMRFQIVVIPGIVERVAPQVAAVRAVVVGP